MIKEKEDSTAQEAFIAEYMERQFKKQEAKWAAEKAAREALMQQVMASRKIQVDDHLKRMAAEREAERQEYEELLRDVAAFQKALELKEHKMSERQKKYFSALSMQAESKRQEREAEREEELEARETAKVVEAAYVQRVNAELAKGASSFNYKRKKVDWME